MRLLVISQFYPPAPEGEAVATWKTVAALARHGHEVTVVCERRGPDRGDWWTLPGVEVEALPAVPALLPRRAAAQLARLATGCYWSSWWSWRAARHAVRLAEARPFDTVISRTEPASGIVAGRFIAGALRRPWLASINDPHPPFAYPPPYGPGRPRGLRERRQLRWVARSLHEAATVIVPCDRLAGWLAGLGALPADVPIAVIPHAGSVAASADAPAAASPVTLLHAGTLRLGRGAARLLEIVHAAQAELAGRATIAVRLLGGIDDEGLTAIGRLGLEGAVTIEPYRALPDSLAAIAGADALLVVEADMSEGVFLPSKVSDYALSGRPVLMLSPATGTVADLAGGLAHPGFLGQQTEHAARRLAAFVTRRAAGDPCLDYRLPPIDGMTPEHHAARWTALLTATRG